MKYGETVRGIFVSRPNRFIAKVEIDGEVIDCHVKNTGRLKELLVSGAEVWLEKAKNPERKTPYDLITVRRYDGELVNIDSQVANDTAEEYLRKTRPDAVIRREVTYGDSRFDFQLQENGKTTYIEVKGVTLLQDGAARFPDAPTERGAKHLRELQKCLEAGLGAEILFVLQMKGAEYFTSNDARDPAFAQELRRAEAAGVKIRAVDCVIGTDSIIPDKSVAVIL